MLESIQLGKDALKFVDLKDTVTLCLFLKDQALQVTP